MGFTKFDLKAGDYVEIYELTGNQNTPGELIKRFDVFKPYNGIFNANCGRFEVKFVSDNWIEGTGFEFYYWAIVGIDELSGFEDVNIYPNPTSHTINVKIVSELNEHINFQIYDMTGRLISSENVYVAGDYIYTKDVSNLAKGFYTMKIHTSKGKSIQKFIVN